jgi:hypothetical protein
MSTTTRRLTRATGLAALIALAPGVVASADDDDDRLLGRAVLPVDTYLTGPKNPPAGAALTAVNPPVTLPLPGQPVAGFSAIVEDTDGKWLAMPDNGFGGKANSRDFLIRAYRLKLELKTADGGDGEVKVGEYVEFSDPDRLIGFPIVNEGSRQRLLTGGDIDPESLQIGPDGDLWVGDEFGPWILHFDRKGRLLEQPIGLPGGLMSPNNPFLGGGTATVPNSRGLEGMGISGQHLYPVLEGATTADLTVDPNRRLMFEYDTQTRAFTGRQWDYRVDPTIASPPSNQVFVSDVAPLDEHRLVVIERDGSNPGVRRRVFVVDVRVTAQDGSLAKTSVLDLAAIPDPDGVSLPEIHAGDVGLGDPFRVTCESVEAIRVVGEDQVLVGCDNNFPNTGRNPGRADDNEFILVQVPEL